MKWKQFLLIVAVSASSAVASVWGYNKFHGQQTAYLQGRDNIPANYAGFFDGKTTGAAEPVDFTKAASSSVPAVVHIKTKIPAKKVSNDVPQRRGFFDDWFDDFFGQGGVVPEQRASGSGVLISEDGYIVTNNHVISNGEGDGVADEITVTLHNKKVYKARVIGKDPSTDIAVLKIDGNNFPFLLYGNSNDVKLGQWVLAVGYPLTLETTVTAGIVSAKGRAIGINSRQSKTPIESFIQTDAAVNQGNSGGALINTNGELIGINSAILAPNGTYAGYSFAIPVSIVKKIVNDIIQYGDVQRAYLGIRVAEDKFDTGDGAYIGTVDKDGAAASAGLKKGDVITKMDNVPIYSWTELQGSVASYKVGDKINITYKRDGKEYTTVAALKNKVGSYDEIAKMNIGDKLGATLETLDKNKARQYGIDGGVVVKTIKEDGPIGRTYIQKNFIITGVNGHDVKSVDELANVLANLSGNIRLEGIYPGGDGSYTYPLNLDEQ
jgi:serine protease Do